MNLIQKDPELKKMFHDQLTLLLARGIFKSKTMGEQADEIIVLLDKLLNAFLEANKQMKDKPL